MSLQRHAYLPLLRSFVVHCSYCVASYEVACLHVVLKQMPLVVKVSVSKAARIRVKTLGSEEV